MSSVMMLLTLLGTTSTSLCHAYHHVAERGPYDELSSEEMRTAFRNLGNHCGKVNIEGAFFVSSDVSLSPVPTHARTRAIHIALEVPPKHHRHAGNFSRFARVALYTAGADFVEEYLVSTRSDYSNVTKLRRIAALKRPVDEVEARQLDYFLHRACRGAFGQFLREYYGAAFMYSGEKDQKTPLCARAELKTGGGRPANLPSCLLAMYASPRVTMAEPQRRVTVFRLSRFVPPYNQHPTDINIKVDHTQTDLSQWRISGLSIQGRQFDRMEDFLALKSNWSTLFTRKINFTNLLAADHTEKLSEGLCPRVCAGATCANPSRPFEGTVVNKHVSYGRWVFDVAVRQETGLRFYDVHFNGRLMAHEAGMDETVTIYGGESAFMRSLTSVESMFNVGSLTSELSPGIDCPVDAVFLSVPVIRSPSAGTRTVQNGICIFASRANLHEGALRRYFQSFEDDTSPLRTGYATGVVEKSLYVVTQAAVFNYQYAFVNVFSANGRFATYVVPSGYIHVDVPTSHHSLYGYVSPRLDLRLSLHTHYFLFFVDALGVNNTVRRIQVHAEGERKGLDRMNMAVGRLATEREGQVESGDPTALTLICLSGDEDSRCLQIVNLSPLKSMVSSNSSRSFSWIRKSLWLTRYKEDEVRASSIYNGVDLTSPVVDFATFSTNDSLDGVGAHFDVVMWISVGFIHIPVNEDMPQTASKGAQLGFMLKPHNFFPHAPDSLASTGSVFTTSEEQWINGYEEAPHRDCEASHPADVSWTH